MMKQICFRAASMLALVGFIGYWSLTVLFVSPNNFVRIQAEPALQFFDRYLQQRWAFFAPPPQADLKIYYTFYDSETEQAIASFEALAPVLAEKQSEFPFNTRADALDYLLSSSGLMLIESLSVQARELGYRANEAVAEEEVRQWWEQIQRVGPRVAPYRTLVQYATLLANRQGVACDAPIVFQFRVAQKKLPSFAAAQSGHSETPALEIMFESAVLPLPPSSS